LRAAERPGGGASVSGVLNATRDSHGATHLHAAARLGRLRVISNLLEHGAEVNVQNNYGETPLYLAALFRHGAVVVYLLKHGADAAMAKEDGNTPLHVAAAWGQAEAVDALCRSVGEGAQRRRLFAATNADGETALGLAKARRAYLERRNVGNPMTTIRMLEDDFAAQQVVIHRTPDDLSPLIKV
jgi:ankyrin repeat protein